MLKAMPARLGRRGLPRFPGPLFMNIARAALFLPAVLVMLGFAAPSRLHAEDRLDRLEREVEQLKKENAQMKNKVEDVTADSEEIKHGMSTFSRFVDVSGYADVEYRLTGEEGQNNGFRVHHLSLFFTKDIQKDWKIFSELEFEDAPRIEADPLADTVSKANGTIFAEQMYIEYHPALSWDVRVGRFLTPAGIWWIYHYPPYVPVQTHPLFYKLVFPEVSDGAQLRNSFVFRNVILDTHLYVANGSGNSGRLDRNPNMAVGGRVNAGFSYGLSVGASYYREKDNSDVMRNSFGLHLLYSRGPWSFQTEYAYRHNHPDASQTFNDKGLYGLVSYYVGKWTFAARAGWYDTNDTDVNNDIYRYTGAVNYHFAHNVVGKVEFDRYLYDDPAKKDYNEVIFAIDLAMGDL